MSKIKLVPCPNMKKDEIALAIISGRRFTLESDIRLVIEEENVIHWDANFGYNPIRNGQKPWYWIGFKHLHELVEQKWWEDTEMVGKPVKVRDLERDEWTLVYFHGYQKHDDYKFCCAAAQWRYAEPLTTADLYQGEV